VLYELVPKGKRVVEGVAECVCRENATAMAIAEVRRYMRVPLTITRVPEAEFDNLLRLAYEGGSYTMQAVEGLDEATDLAHLAQDLPENVDLLDSDDEVLRLGLQPRRQVRRQAGGHVRHVPEAQGEEGEEGHDDAQAGREEIARPEGDGREGQPGRGGSRENACRTGDGGQGAGCEDDGPQNQGREGQVRAHDARGDAGFERRRAEGAGDAGPESGQAADAACAA